MKTITRSYLGQLTYEVNGAVIEVHKMLGPGLLESVYHECMVEELTLRGINFASEMIIDIDYKGKLINAQLRCDFFIENCLVVELKAVAAILPIHEAQLMTYMKLLKVPKGLLLNFHCSNMYKYGQKTYINQLFSKLDD